MNKEDKICAFCKYHFIEEISFDSPQSCCKKRKATTEKWLKCDDFEYSDRYIEALQQKLNQLETNIDEAIEYIKHSWWLRTDQTYDTSKDLKGWEVEKIIEILKGGSNE